MAHGALLYGFTWSLHKNRLHVVSRRKEEKRVLRMGLRLVPQAFVLPSFILPTAVRCKIAIGESRLLFSSNPLFFSHPFSC